MPSAAGHIGGVRSAIAKGARETLMCGHWAISAPHRNPGSFSRHKRQIGSAISPTPIAFAACSASICAVEKSGQRAVWYLDTGKQRKDAVAFQLRSAPPTITSIPKGRCARLDHGDILRMASFHHEKGPSLDWPRAAPWSWLLPAAVA